MDVVFATNKCAKLDIWYNNYLQRLLKLAMNDVPVLFYYRLYPWGHIEVKKKKKSEDCI